MINQLTLVKTNASLWLQFEENTEGEVTLLTCSVCKQFQKEIQYNHDFSDVCIKGSTNLCLSIAKDHSATKCPGSDLPTCGPNSSVDHSCTTN